DQRLGEEAEGKQRVARGQTLLGAHMAGGDFDHAIDEAPRRSVRNQILDGRHERTYLRLNASHMLQPKAMIEIPVRSTRREEMIHGTDEAVRLARGVEEGVLWLHCPHTTAALTIQENTDPDLRDDYLHHLAKLVPRAGFKHSEGNADAHIKASLIGSTQTV